MRWMLLLSKRRGGLRRADAEALVGESVCVVLVGDHMDPSAGALLVADSSALAGKRARWWLHDPEGLPRAGDLPTAAAHRRDRRGDLPPAG